MIIIPEIETIVILTPRTGSTVLHHAVTDKYPLAFMPWRHMEADGIPLGYGSWRKVGACRHPVHRLWSLYNYLLDIRRQGHKNIAYVTKMYYSVHGRSFEDWLTGNAELFVSGNTPFYTCRHNIPETRKSQRVYLRPDLGTKLYPYAALDKLAFDLEVKLEPQREKLTVPPKLTEAGERHIREFFSWDLENCHE